MPALFKQSLPSGCGKRGSMTGLYPLLLAAVAFAAHFNGLQGAFQFDDYNVIVNNKAVHSWTALMADLPHGIRPLLKLTYALNWTSGLGAPGFHLLNLGIHLANTLLIFALGKRLLNSHEGLSPSTAAPAAFLTALLFAVHPVQTEAVTYICGRSTSLMALFYLAGCLAYIRGAETNRRLLSLPASVTFFLLAMLAKETAVTLPAALLLWETSRSAREPFKQIMRRQGIHWLMLLGFLLALLLHPNYGELLEYSFDTRSLRQNLISQATGISYLLSRLILVHQLNIDPDIQVMSAVTAPVAAQAAALMIIFGAGLAALRTRPLFGFGVIWFFLQLLPTNSLVPRLDIANDRQLYLAVFGLFLPLGLAVSRFAIRGIRQEGAVLSALFVLVIILVTATIRRNCDYRSEIALWEDTARKSPRKARVYNNLGYAYQLAGRYADAREAYRRALELEPGFRKARNNLDETENLLQRTAHGLTVKGLSAR